MKGIERVVEEVEPVVDPFVEKSMHKQAQSFNRPRRKAAQEGELLGRIKINYISYLCQLQREKKWTLGFKIFLRVARIHDALFLYSVVLCI